MKTREGLFTYVSEGRVGKRALERAEAPGGVCVPAAAAGAAPPTPLARAHSSTPRDSRPRPAAATSPP